MAHAEEIEHSTLAIRMDRLDRELLQAAARIARLAESSWARSVLVRVASELLAAQASHGGTHED